MKTLLVVGGGARTINHFIRYYVNKYELPTVYSLNGKGVISDYNSNCYGMIGWKGTANHLIEEAERIILIGSRADIRQFPDLKVLDNKEVYSIFSTVGVDSKSIDLYDIDKLNYTYWEPVRKTDNIFMQSYSYRDHYITVDVGNHQMEVANRWYIDDCGKWITSGGLGTMGFAIPAAIGVAIQGHKTLAICGDGGFQMSIPELETIKHLKLPIKILVMNNLSLNLVKQFQDSIGLEPQSTVNGYSCPDISKIAMAYGFNYSNTFDFSDNQVIMEIKQ
jgi:acetolactate synthase-1/2/3 large subunit